MAEFVYNNNHKDDCGDKKDKYDVPSTSKAGFNDPNQIAHNVNDLKIFDFNDFNSADDVRQTVSLLRERHMQQTVDVKKDLLQKKSGEVIVNVCQVNKDCVTLESDKPVTTQKDSLHKRKKESADVKKDHQEKKSREKGSAHMCKVNKDFVKLERQSDKPMTRQNDSSRNRKRAGRPMKQRTSKRLKISSSNCDVCKRKKVNVIFINCGKRYNSPYETSDDDDSI